MSGTAKSQAAPAEPSKSGVGFLWAHLSLVLIAFAVAYPSPLAVLWGGRTQGSVTEPFIASGIWLGLLLFLARQTRVATSPTKQGFWSGLSVIADVLGLTLLLSVSGAAQNPFTMLYFVPITLATLVAERFTWRVAALSVLCFGLLLKQTADVLRPHQNHPHHAHFFDHVQGMAIALAVAGVFITLFVHFIARALKNKQAQIDQLHQEQQNDRFAVSLGALSAGAAHELGTPLGSVQLLAEELTHLPEAERVAAVETIVSEVRRMKSILHSMSATELSAEVLHQRRAWQLTELSELPTMAQVTFSCPEGLATTQPRAVIEQLLRELVKNAQLASEQKPVATEIVAAGDFFLLKVIDRGGGLDARRQRTERGAAALRLHNWRHRSRTVPRLSSRTPTRRLASHRKQ